MGGVRVDSSQNNNKAILMRGAAGSGLFCRQRCYCSGIEFGNLTQPLADTIGGVVKVNPSGALAVQLPFDLIIGNLLCAAGSI